MIFNIISIIMFLVRYLPDIIQLVKKIIESIRGIKDKAEQKEVIADLTETLHEMKKTKEMRLLDEFIKRRNIKV